MIELVLAHTDLARDTRLLVVPGGGHGTSLLEFGSDAPRVLAVVRRFLARVRRAAQPEAP